LSFYPENTALEISEIKHPISGNVHFDDVHFHYESRQDVEVLKGLSFEVKSGQFQQTVNNVSCNPNQTSTEDLRLIYVYHFENEGYRSPYNSKQTQLHPDTGIRGNFGTPNEGFSHITKSSDYKNLIITTSYKTGEQPLVSIIRDPRT
jgi:hypothetical protein